MSIGVVLAFMCMMLLNLAANAQIRSIMTPEVTVRRLGSPQRAHDRILTENFTTLEHLDELAEDPELSDVQRLVYANAPLILWYGSEFPADTSTPIGIYYIVSQSTSGEAVATTVRYYLWFSNEPGGMPIESRLATYGHSLDRELVYRVTLLGDEVVGAYYQAPGHRLITMDYSGESRPVFTIASANHNFRQVTDRELDFPGEKLLLAPLPHVESPWSPAHDPDFAALAVDEIWDTYLIDVREYVFVEFQMPTVSTAATISVRIDDRWYYLHEQIGGGVTRPGYNQVGIEIGYTVLPGDIQEVRIVAYSSRRSTFEPVRVTIYPRNGVPG